jgi:hypothetical protein
MVETFVVAQSQTSLRFDTQCTHQSAMCGNSIPANLILDLILDVLNCAIFRITQFPLWTLFALVNRGFRSGREKRPNTV